MTSTRSQVFDLPLSTYAGPLHLWTSTCGRHEIHIALLKRLVQRPSGPRSIAEIRLYDCNLLWTTCMLPVCYLLAIHITNSYRWKFTLFIPAKGEILVKETPTSLQKKKGRCQWTLISISIFCVDVHMGLDHPLPRPHASTWARTLFPPTASGIQLPLASNHPMLKFFKCVEFLSIIEQ